MSADWGQPWLGGGVCEWREAICAHTSALLICAHTSALLICADTCLGVMGASVCACKLMFLRMVLGEGALVSAPSGHSAALGVLAFGFGRHETLNPGLIFPIAVSLGKSLASSEPWLPYLENGD